MLEIFEIINKLLSKDSVLTEIFKGKEKKLQEFQLELTRELNTLNEKQIELNKVEASNTNIFVAGWRPFIGWCCGFALVYNFILQPFISLIFNLDAPILEITQLISILLAMLGMYGSRTYEKIKLNKS